MIVLTGAAGFIGSVMLGYLNKMGRDDVVLFDDMPYPDQFLNIGNKRYISIHSADEIISDPENIDCVIHLGANSNTLEKNWRSIYETNVYSTRLWNQFCAEHNIPFIFASSAAVYGNSNGPLNHYAFSKLASEKEITNGIVLRLFNVYGPNEYHKGRMASTPYHWFNQLIENRELKLFDDSINYYRDFIWVEDVARTVYHFLNNYQEGIYDLGTGNPVSFENVASYCLDNVQGMKKYIPMPNDLAAQYQKNTCASIDYLESAGVNVKGFVNIEEGIKEYFNYLSSNQTY